MDLDAVTFEVALVPFLEGLASPRAPTSRRSTTVFAAELGDLEALAEAGGPPRASVGGLSIVTKGG